VRILAYSVSYARPRRSAGLWPRRPDAPSEVRGSLRACRHRLSRAAVSRPGTSANGPTRRADTRCPWPGKKRIGRRLDEYSGWADQRTGLIRQAGVNILGQPVRVLPAGNPSRALESPGKDCSRRVHPERSRVRTIIPGLPRGYQAVIGRDRDTLDQPERCRRGLNPRASLAHRSDELDEAIRPNETRAVPDEVTLQLALGAVPRGRIPRASRIIPGPASSRHA